MSFACTLPAVWRLAVVAVTFKLVPAVDGFNVTVLAALSETEALVPAVSVSDVAVVSATPMLVPATATSLPVVSVPVVETAVAAFRLIEELAVSGLVRVTSANVELRVRFLVVTVPSAASFIVPPALTVTELVPLRVPPTVTV